MAQDFWQKCLRCFDLQISFYSTSFPRPPAESSLFVETIVETAFHPTVARGCNGERPAPSRCSDGKRVDAFVLVYPLASPLPEEGRMTRLPFVAVATFLLFVPTLVAQNTDPRIGTWKLVGAVIAPNGEFGQVKPASVETMAYQPTASGFKVVADSLLPTGRNNHYEVEASLDGKEYSVTNNLTSLQVTRQFRRIDDHTYAEVTKVDGVVTLTRTVEISPDGKTLKATDIATDNSFSAVMT